ncbi:hypothetical protein P152DRAFT_512268 [Eremomyces bilateralis CBS 781.70]|uniref:Uncharacterized protein n=1 Tax=Eremomyces bilateralis CBS 781.70 TaxID=1392243 RepID=A0A6G1GAK9_9PEZI|nr:uncharacterized protein P152DRAFT_512268 [Eremomyces bilateralis CBS 781.70]KAF1814940.1 hypothetical protein P152DRAFT_512268 [Eremomyces bilateralis CBS 781.70]
MTEMITASPFGLASSLLCGIVLLKAKPPSETVEDFIHSLRHCIRCREAQSEGSAGGFDNASYWKSRFLRSQRDSERLQARLSKAELILRQLETEPEANGSVLNDELAKKDTLGMANLVKVYGNTYRSKSRQSKSTSRRSPNGGLVLESMSQGSDILQHVHKILSIIKSQPVQPGLLAFHCSFAISALSSLVSNSFDDVHTGATTTESSVRSRISSLCLGFERILSVLTSALTKLDVPDRSGTFGSTIYCSVSCFTDLLKYLKQTCSDAAVRMHNNETMVIGGAKPNSNPPVKKQKTRPNTISAEFTTYLLIAWLRMLSDSSAAHRKLFESMAACVLNAVGNELYTSTFAATRATTITKETRNLERRLDPLALDIYSHYLLQTFHVVMDLSARFLNADDSGEDAESCAGRPAAGLGVDFEERLQQTLIYGIFGAPGARNAQAVPLQVQKQSLVSYTPVQEGEESHAPLVRLESEVWQRLGWKILQGEMKMDNMAEAKLG